MSRSHGRSPDALRPVTLTPSATKHAEGSCLVEFGDTRVLVTCSVEDRVPPHVYGTGQGWVTAEYGMLPRATKERTRREASAGKQTGRTQEIQRLIGRSARAAVDVKRLGNRTLTLDCDVLQADGGTRTAAITGASVALELAVRHLVGRGQLPQGFATLPVAAVSVGMKQGVVLVDLDYAEDSTADVDLNLVELGNGRLVEVQGTAERGSFSPQELSGMVAAGERALAELFALQARVLGR